VRWDADLDTHILLRALIGGNEVTPRERSLLERNRWGISAIVFGELTKLHQLDRISVSLEDPAVAHALERIECGL